MAGTDHLVTYLSLTADFGGTRFGPFEGLEVRLGSDSNRCHIVLPEALGVFAEHVKLIRQSSTNLILSPADRTATVFLYKQNERRPLQINTATAVRPGDSFALVTPDGPRFVIEVGELPPEIKAQREGRGGRRFGGRRFPDGKAFKDEGKRQIWTTLLTTGPGQIAQRAYTYVISGAIFQPRNIIMMGMFLLAGGGMGIQRCNIRNLQRQNQTSVTRYESCQRDLDTVNNLKNKSVTDYNFHELAASVLNSTSIGEALQEDQKLRELVKQKAAEINQEDYEWVSTAKGAQASMLGAWRRQLSDMDSDTAWLLLWAAASPGLGRDEFRVVSDSTGSKVCGRGPLSLSYRQSLRLGVDAQPDAYFLGDASQMSSDGVMEEHVLAELAVPNHEVEPGGEYDLESLNNTQQCVFRTGTDARNRVSRLASDLRGSLGSNGRFLPPDEASWRSVAAIAKLYAADIPENDYTDRGSLNVNFSETHVSQSLKDLGPEGEWVLERTAEVIARAMVLPCYATLSGSSTEVTNMLGETLPPDLSCLILNYRLQNDL